MNMHRTDRQTERNLGCGVVGGGVEGRGLNVSISSRKNASSRKHDMESLVTFSGGNSHRVNARRVNSNTNNNSNVSNAVVLTQKHCVREAPAALA